MICLDMDGTLLNDRKEISSENKQAIEKAKAAGVKVIICTGRLFESAVYYDGYLGLNNPIISANGAYIKDRKSGEVIYKAKLGKENCFQILKVLRKYNIAPNFQTPYGVYTEENNPGYEMYLKINKELPEDRKMKINLVENWDKTFNEQEEDILKCIAIEQDIEKLKKAKNELLNNSQFEIASSFRNNFEVMTAGISKGRGVEKLAAYYGFHREEVICVGDNENDLSMIEYAGLGVAMGNGEEFVKSKANYITGLNNEHGVAQVIEKFILSK